MFCIFLFVCFLQAQRHITDLYEDLRDGHNLISLLEVLSGETLVSADIPMVTLHHHGYWLRNVDLDANSPSTGSAPTLQSLLSVGVMFGSCVIHTLFVFSPECVSAVQKKKSKCCIKIAKIIIVVVEKKLQDPWISPFWSNVWPHHNSSYCTGVFCFCYPQFPPLSGAETHPHSLQLLLNLSSTWVEVTPRRGFLCFPP